MQYPLDRRARTLVLVATQASLFAVTLFATYASDHFSSVARWIVALLLIGISVAGGALLLRGAMRKHRPYDFADAPSRWVHHLEHVKPWNRVALFVFVVVTTVMSAFAIGLYLFSQPTPRQTGFASLFFAVYLGWWFWRIIDRATNPERVIDAL